jgi:hypothetical protein
MLIYYFSPHSSLKQYGQECNHYCELVKDMDAWICISDQDVMFFTTLHQARQIEGIISRHPEIDLFTVTTNRVNNPNQCVPGMFAEYDIIRHVSWAQMVQAKYDDHPDQEIELTTRPISGLVMIFRKRTWMKMGGFINGLAGVDSAFSTKLLDAGGKIGIMKGVYVLHYYRAAEGGADYTAHLESKK